MLRRDQRVGSIATDPPIGTVTRNNGNFSQADPFRNDLIVWNLALLSRGLFLATCEAWRAGAPAHAQVGRSGRGTPDRPQMNQLVAFQVPGHHRQRAMGAAAWPRRGIHTPAVRYEVVAFAVARIPFNDGYRIEECSASESCGGASRNPEDAFLSRFVNLDTVPGPLWRANC